MRSPETGLNESSPAFRLDVPLHCLLMQRGSRSALPPAIQHIENNDENNDTFITMDEWSNVDWLMEKRRAGYKIVNSASGLDEMLYFLRGKVQEWNCRAGFNLIVRTDGTLAPCFPMYNATCDWKTIENHRFETKQLTEMKRPCQPHCFSTLNHILAYCYNDARVIKWMFRQALNRFQGTTNFD
jgi:hypothetical protein